jgi:glyoxylase-like metal-dependent hydrolase (beta-lactamase superfamily II)
LSKEIGIDLIDQELGPLTILFGHENGKYPHGNALHIKGTNKSAIIDPNLGTIARVQAGRKLPHVDMVIHSHAHEDHIAGSHLFSDVPWYIHEDDAVGLTGIDGLMEIYGLDEPLNSEMKIRFQEDFFYSSNEDVTTFRDGDVLDLGGVQIKVLHTPGHTRGHCCLIITWEGSDEGYVYLGDIDLTGFGPYYGDAWSDLKLFEASIEKLRNLDAHWWQTFHHKGLIEGRERFLEMLEAFSAMIGKREHSLLEYLGEPRSIEQLIEHRFIYRPGAVTPMIDAIEKRSIEMHLERLLEQGRISHENNTYRVI